MNKKIITICFLVILLTGCDNKSKLNDNTISKNTEEYMLAKDTFIKNDEIDKEREIKIDDEYKEEIHDLSDDDTAIYEKTQETPKLQNKIETSNETHEYDKNYSIHYGRVDCLDIDSCISLSNPIQLTFNNIISDIRYLEVKTGNTIKGYFIEYTFNDYIFDSQEICNEIGNSIKDKLSDRITNYECTDNNTLKIETDYGRENE